MPHGVVSRLLQIEENKEDKPPPFLYVDAGKDAAFVRDFARRAMTRLLGAGPRDGFQYWVSGIDPERRLVTDPETAEQVCGELMGVDQSPETKQREWRSCLRGCISGSLSAGALFGLLYGFLLRGLEAVGALRIDWTVFPLQLFGAEIRPRLYDLIWLAAIAVVVVNKRLSKAEEKSRTRPLQPWMEGGGMQPVDGPPKGRVHPVERHRHWIRLAWWTVIVLTILSWFAWGGMN